MGIMWNLLAFKLLFNGAFAAVVLMVIAAYDFAGAYLASRRPFEGSSRHRQIASTPPGALRDTKSVTERG